ncbi:hypothetical protein FXN63_09765 [Pigmentiphaga aceris]|uniref:Uncharacterized protein n=1 Tax=Pigmentiphaga aceris TaxID=1940612 RepID=A0A5C0AUJ0_9BURK|nr:hypothetical protein [Pigmentiphaga aceris]QEI06089.1 hypothetical protein FXN63_09765 [Pigmentiphaga aceris]
MNTLGNGTGFAANRCLEASPSLAYNSEDVMTTATEKPSWSTPSEALLNVPQSERMDDAGEPSELKSSDLPSLAGHVLESPAPSSDQADARVSTASPEAPLVSDDKAARAGAVKSDSPSTASSTKSRHMAGIGKPENQA